MDKMSIYFVLVAISAIFYTGNSASTGKDEKLTVAQSAKANNSSVLDYDAIIDECNAPFRLDIEYFKSSRKSGGLILAQLKCYIRCILVKSEMMSEDGELNKDWAKTTSPGELNGEMYDADMVNKCIAESTETDHCDKAFTFANCVLEGDIEEDEDK